MTGGQRDGVVDTRHGQDAHGAAGAVDEAHIAGHQVLDPVAEDGVRVAPAELHQPILTTRIRLRGDGLGEAPGEALITKLVDVSHAPPPAWPGTGGLTPRSSSRSIPAALIRARVRSASSSLRRFRA